MIGIIDYGVGNLASIRNMLRRVDVESTITSDVASLAACEKLILPGVGAFDTGIRNLRESGLWDVLNERVVDAKVPILGICLGVQLFTEGSDEGSESGLGWIPGRTVSFDRTRLADVDRVPNMGWRDIEPARESRLTGDLPVEPRFYFVHSFHLDCAAEDVILTSQHGYSFAAGVERGNVVGVQFHPEKSHKYGMQLLKNFAEQY